MNSSHENNTPKSYGGGYARNASIPPGTSILRRCSCHRSNEATATNSLINTMHEEFPNPGIANRTSNTDGLVGTIVKGQGRGVSRSELKQGPPNLLGVVSSSKFL